MDTTELPDILKPRHEWSCAACGIRYVLLREDDLETNKAIHLASEWHASNTSGE